MPAPQPVVKVVREGDTSKPRNNPFTIVIVSNPALESPRNSGRFVVDPITADRAAFDGCVGYIGDALFGSLPGQAEALLADPAIGPNVRVVSLFIAGLSAADPNSLVAEDDVSNLVMPRRMKFVPLLGGFRLSADVAYAVTASPDHDRASAYFTSDDDAMPGVPFTLDGVTLAHRFENLIPGTIALPVTSHSLTALHEFGHALSSYSNGSIVDLYVDDGPGVNSKRGRPIPGSFATYNGTGFASDAARDGLGYPATWQSYHPELHDPANPAVMDNYWAAPEGASVACQHDKLTRQFLKDRLMAKIARP